jgi:hypothetical protein
VPHRFAPAEALEAARRAVSTGRVRARRRQQDQFADLDLVAEDVEHAMETATLAEPIGNPEEWRLSGGTTVDGAPLIVEISVEQATIWVVHVRKE